jgi:hypothetical protein
MFMGETKKDDDEESILDESERLCGDLNGDLGIDNNNCPDSYYCSSCKENECPTWIGMTPHCPKCNNVLEKIPRIN